MAAYTNTVMVADTTDVAGFLGKSVDAGFTTAMQDLVGVYTEAYLCNLMKYDLITNWASLNSKFKLIFSEYVARMIAVEGIKYEMAGYTSRIEAEDLINIHLYRINEIKEILERSAVKDFLGT